MFHSIRFPRVVFIQHHRTIEQKQFSTLAHSMDTVVRRELKAFARTVWHEERPLNLPGLANYRLRREDHFWQVIWGVVLPLPIFWNITVP